MASCANACSTPDVERVLSVGRNAIGQQHPKLQESLQAGLFDLAPIEKQLQGYDTCFFCLGVSSVGMTEQAYRHMTSPCPWRKRSPGSIPG
jgi:hypothetical protein